MILSAIVHGLRDVSGRLGRLTGRLRNPEPAFDSLVDQLLAAHRDRFAGRGVRWKQPAPATLARRRRDGITSTRPLIREGALRASLTRRGALGQVLITSRNQLTFGTRIWYAGLASGRLGMGRRAPVGLTRPQRIRVVAEFERQLIGDVAR